MCEISEKIYQQGEAEGFKEGRADAKRETALNLAKMGLSIEQIAVAVNVSVSVVKQWLDSSL